MFEAAPTRQWFAFSVADESFVVPPEWVEAIVDVDELMDLPEPPQLVDGIARSAGRALPLVSLASRMDASESTNGRDGTHRGRALALSVDGIALLLRCDAVLGSCEGEREPRPCSAPATSLSADFVDGEVNVAGGIHRCISIERVVSVIRRWTSDASSQPHPAVSSRDQPTPYVFFERGDRWLAVRGDRLREVRRAREGAAEGVDLDAWLGGEVDESKPERMLDFGDGWVIRTRSNMTVVGPDDATEAPLPALLAPWGYRLGIRALMMRQGRLGLSLDPVAFIRSSKASARGKSDSPSA